MKRHRGNQTSMNVQNISNTPEELLFYISNIDVTYTGSVTSSVLFFVVSGRIEMVEGNTTSVFNKEGFVIVNSSQQVVLRSISTQTIVCGVEIPNAIVRTTTGTQIHQFDCNTSKQTSLNHNDVVQQLRRLIKLTSSERQKQILLIYSVYYELMDLLIKKYLVLGKDLSYASNRLENALEYIHTNHNRKLTLDEMADFMFMSKSYFSRYFKQEMGLNFVEYLRDVRLKEALKDIKSTDKPITQIAFDAGFSSTNAFGQALRKMYGISPSEYRKEAQINYVSDQQLKMIACPDEILSGEDSWNMETTHEEYIEYQKYILRNIEIKKNYFQGLSYMYVGTAAILNDGKFQKQLITMTKSLHLGGFIVDKLFDEIQNDSLSYMQSFEKYKTMIDFIMENHYQVILMIPMNDSIIERIALIVDVFLEYLLNNYNASYIANFNFSLDFSISDDAEEWISTSNAIIKSIKKVSKEVMVGGPTITLESLDYYINHSNLLNDISFDFISCTYFSDIAKQKGISVKAYIKAVKDLLPDKKTRLKDNVYIIKYNTSSKKSYLQDSIFKASQVMSELIEMLDLVKVVSYAPISDFVVENVKKRHILDGSAGLMTQDGIYKPVFYTFKFMRHLNNGLIFANENFLVSRDDSMRISILAHNLNYDALATKELQSIEGAMDTNRINTNPKKVITFVISDMFEGYYEIRSYCISQTKGDLIHEWSKWNYKDYFKKSDLDYLKSVTHPELLIKEVDVEDNKLYVDVELESNAFSITYIESKKR